MKKLLITGVLLLGGLMAFSQVDSLSAGNLWEPVDLENHPPNTTLCVVGSNDSTVLFTNLRTGGGLQVLTLDNFIESFKYLNKSVKVDLNSFHPDALRGLCNKYGIIIKEDE